MLSSILLRYSIAVERRFLSTFGTELIRRDRDHDRRIEEMMVAKSAALPAPQETTLHQYPTSPHEPRIPLSEVLTDTFKFVLFLSKSLMD